MTLQEAKEQTAKAAGFTLSNKDKGLCVQCNEPFSNENVYTTAGWLETEVSGLCEACWDGICGVDLDCEED
jgi:hypothetical protein